MTLKQGRRNLQVKPLATLLTNLTFENDSCPLLSLWVTYKVFVYVIWWVKDINWLVSLIRFQLGSKFNGKLTNTEGPGCLQFTHQQLRTEVVLGVEQCGILEVNRNWVTAQDLCSAPPLPAGALLLNHHLVLTAEKDEFIVRQKAVAFSCVEGWFIRVRRLRRRWMYNSVKSTIWSSLQKCKWLL